MAEEALLASWRDTATREVIVDFVRSVDSPPEDRVATFDNDGTLWCEKPIPIQLDFLLHRMAQQAADDPSLADRQPYKAASERDLGWLGQAMIEHYQGDDTDIGLLMAASGAAFGGTTVEAFSGEVREWFATAEHPTLGRPYLACAFVPMVELLRYLEANGFRTFIASGGDRDFMRPFAEELYGVPPERVIGSAYGLEVDATGDDLHLLYKTEIDFFDDGDAKPARIWSRIGRRPLVAGGNSNGDVPMLRFASAAGRDALRLVVRHDDAEREFDDASGAEGVLQRADEQGWTVVSMKDDWATVFSDA